MTLGPASTIEDVAVSVAHALRKHHIKAILTGGACASIHADGVITSFDVDFVLEGRVPGSATDRALAPTGYRRDHDHYVHPNCPFIVEFPAGPLGIGDDDEVVPVEIQVGHNYVLGLSATDSCRDRLAAYYHWNDKQGLAAAVAIARRRAVDLTFIAKWSKREGASASFDEFRRALSQSKRRRTAQPRRR